MNLTKAADSYREQTSGYQCGSGQFRGGGGGYRLPGVRQAVGVYVQHGQYSQCFNDKCKWKVTSKNCIIIQKYVR